MKDLLMIQGGEHLKGIISISGSKNAALPIIAASLLSSEEVELANIPRLGDVEVMLNLIREAGANIKEENNAISINTPRIINTTLSNKAQLIRPSILLAGPLLAKVGAIKLPFPGGCNIGTRKIDFHLKGLEVLGAKTKIINNFVHIEVNKNLQGAKIALPFASVGATESILMAASLAEGETILTNASIEPEVVDLENFLTKMGANVEGIGTRVLRIKGVEELKGARHTIIPDRVETGTYIAATAIANGEIELENCNMNIMKNVIEKFTEIGVEIEGNNKAVKVKMDRKPLLADIITQPYPGFPTDMHPIMTPLVALAKGGSTIKETIYDNRFQYVQELRKMGARIEIRGDTLLIDSIDKFRGARVVATDIRGGAGVILAGLAAEGTTVVESLSQIDRGYEQIDKKLQSVGARVKRLQVQE